tara:strand:+ start:4019 stop:5041 length:1023 start_codon:yes stop_codon:yes gene_type:complete
MTIARDSKWSVLDYTPLATLVERTDNALDQLGLFEEIFGQTTTAEVERITEGSDTVEAKERGGDRNYAGDEQSQIEYFRIPFFPLDKLAKPQDVQDLREYGEANTPASVERRVEKNIARIRRSHDFLRRSAMYACLKGNTYASGLAGSQYVKNYASVFGVTADVFTGGINFTDAAADPALYVEKNCREHITDNAKDNASNYSVVALCGSGFFNSMIHHPLVQAAYSQYSSREEVLRNRLGGDIVGRLFEHKGVLYIEDVSKQIARDEAFVLPQGISDMFQMHYAPSDTIEGANMTAEPLYIFLEEDRRKVAIETETSFVCVNTRPELVCNLTSNTLLPDA